jgi:outer membrane protein
MFRSSISTFALLMVCLLALMPQRSVALDLFDTEQSVHSEKFSFSQDGASCDRERINKPLTLADVVDLALCNNPQTHSLWIDARIQAANVGANMAAYLPTLSAQGGISRDRTSASGLAVTSNTRRAGLTISYLLYDFGGRSANLENAKQLLIAANATRDATLQSNYLNAVQSYYALLSARASVQALQVAEASARESLDAAQTRYDAGVATPADKLQAQTALSQATLNLVTARGNERNAQGALANTMGFDANQPFTLAPVQDIQPNPVVEQDIGMLIDEARHNRPDLAAADAQIKAAEAQFEATRATGMPSITLDASSNSTKMDNSPFTNTGSINLTLNVPLFSGMRNSYQNRGAELQVENQKAARDLLSNRIALEVWNAYQALLTNSQALRTANDLVASAEQAEEMTLGRYKAGVGNILDVLSAQSTLASARQQKVAALYNFLTSRVALTQSIGELDMTGLDQNATVIGK